MFYPTLSPAMALALSEPALVYIQCSGSQSVAPRTGIFRPRWSSGYHTCHWIRGSRVQTLSGSKDFFFFFFFERVKILIMTSLGREVKS